MSTFSRRGFITRTSLSVAAVGALGALGSLPALADSPTQAPAQSQPMPGLQPFAPVPAPAVTGGAQPFMVFISDPSTGAGTIMVGEHAIPFTNSAIVQSLHQATLAA